MSSHLINAALVVVFAVVMVANFEGLIMVLQAESIWQHALAALIAFAVAFLVFVFWHVAFDVVPVMGTALLRTASWTVLAVGLVLVLSVSAWWSAVAIGGRQAMASQGETVLAAAERTLADASAAAGEFQAATPRVDALTDEVGQLAACEFDVGCVTSKPGPGGVQQLLLQLAESSAGIAKAASDGTASLEAAIERAKQCLTGIRAPAGGESTTDDDALSGGIDCFNTALAAIANVNAGAQMHQALSAFTSGVIVPVSISSDAQKAAASRILEGLAAKAAAIATSIEHLASVSQVKPVTLGRLSPMQAVLVHWDKMIPALMTAIGLDLMPVLFLLFKTLMNAHLRRRPEDVVLNWSVGDLLTAKRMLDGFAQPIREIKTIEWKAR
jgi:hypothetical protein